MHIFNEMLKRRYWAAFNDNFTLADLSLTITVAQLKSNGFDLTPYTKIPDWFNRCETFLHKYKYDVCVNICWNASLI